MVRFVCASFNRVLSTYDSPYLFSTPFRVIILIPYVFLSAIGSVNFTRRGLMIMTRLGGIAFPERQNEIGKLLSPGLPGFRASVHAERSDGSERL